MMYIFFMKLICAPMATLSHPAFRFLIEKFAGCDEYFTEMINAPSLINAGPFEKFYVETVPVPERLVFQLTGKNAESMAIASEILCEKECKGIDLNMGCSAPEIERSGAGISWMLKPLEETENLVRLVKKSIENSGKDIRLSAKIRLGSENFTDESFFSFCDMLVSSGVQAITVHPRTKKEKYRDKPKYIYVQKLCERFKNENIEIFANGDVKDFSSYKEVLKICPSVSGVMIGRALVQKPWLCSLLKRTESEENPSIEIDFLSLALDFIDDVKRFQPPEFYKTRLQRFFSYFCDNFSFAHYARTSLLNAKSIEETCQRLYEYFEKVPEDRIKRVGL